MRQKKAISKSPAAKPATRPPAGKANARPAGLKVTPAMRAAQVKAENAALARFAAARVEASKSAAAKSSAARRAKAASTKAKHANTEAPPRAAVQPAKKKLAAKPRGRAIRQAKFSVGQVVRHRIYPFRGVVFDIDPVFANTDEWLAAIPADVRPRKNQPFYHLLAESAETEYIAYVSEQNLLPDETGQPLRHPQINEYFVENDDGTFRAVFLQAH